MPAAESARESRADEASCAAVGTPGLGDRPLVVLGAERSGTTMLATLMGRHSAFAALPETHLYDVVIPRFGPNPTAAEITREISKGLRRWDDFGVTEGDLERAIAERMDAGLGASAAAFRGLCELQAAQAGRLRYVEKTPAHLFYVSKIVEDVPTARFVVIVRDARDVCFSLLKAPWSDDPPKTIAARWRRAVLEGLGVAKRFGDRTMLVRYEDVVMRPEETLSAICAHAGVEYEPTMLEPSDEAKTVPDWEREWKSRANAALDPARGFAWRRAEDRGVVRLVSTMTADALRLMGYPAGPRGSFSKGLRPRAAEWVKFHPLRALFVRGRSVRARRDRVVNWLWSMRARSARQWTPIE